MASSSERDVQRSVIALNARAWGIAFGLVLGGGLLLATLFLVVKSGPNPGQHLRLLSVFFPGYSVTVVGALVGFVYAFVLGYALGRVIGLVYNRIAFR
ncbi:MAG: hypothetical protein IT358_11990 [Gemmatimonadaceae bacterium]|jgi:hypothetical protein|nr:hypothetical protein [Gemmatimonadota bacterium]MCC7324549.1 hypothetical protein [Gemmatimonadaceae bacterium]MBK7833453.1 hypothetical protein [Gemmatimonadota bacterium]MBK8061031.1 hypothetical protein [Gemmatimonadota bacterium]MBK8646356.1 hypothetical protein [Gemmatimonadota bacterium]